MVRPTGGPAWPLDRCQHCEMVSVKMRSMSSECKPALWYIFLSLGTAVCLPNELLLDMLFLLVPDCQSNV